MKVRSLVWGISVLALAAGTVMAATIAPRAGAGANWPTIGGGPQAMAFSGLRQINSANIGKLGLAWYRTLPGEAGLEATPLAVDGTLYFTGSFGDVYAVDGVSGKVLWKFDPPIVSYDAHSMPDVSRGVAYAQGRIFSAAGDGRLFALDAKTGRMLWTVQTLTPGPGLPHSISGAPCAFDGKVIIGNSGGDGGLRGYVTAYDATTGREAWRFYVAPGTPAENRGDPAMERAAKTWNPNYWKIGTGGTVWGEIVFDRDLNQIYLGTGNQGSYNGVALGGGGGDNLYTESIVALNADTGKLVWYYQVVPGDQWDYDNTGPMILATLPIDGRRRQILMQAPKDGFFYVIDRRTGRFISAPKYGKVTWAERVDVATGRPVVAESALYRKTGTATVWPSNLGLHDWQAMSYSPETGLVYLPYMQAGTKYIVGGVIPGQLHMFGVSLVMLVHKPDMGGLLAWDPVHQRAVWNVPEKPLYNGGTLATGGDLVFQGTADGYLSAYDASTGRRLWHFNAGLGIMAAPMSYSVGGRQYVSVLVGYGGPVALLSQFTNEGWNFRKQPRRLLTFALGGSAMLPPTPPADMHVDALDVPSFHINPTDAAEGSTLFTRNCSGCHGNSLVSIGGAPDLRSEPAALYPDSLWTVLHNGLVPNGMPRFANLTHGQVMDLYTYIRAGARAVIKSQKLAEESGRPR